MLLCINFPLMVLILNLRFLLLSKESGSKEAFSTKEK